MWKAIFKRAQDPEVWFSDEELTNLLLISDEHDQFNFFDLNNHISNWKKEVTSSWENLTAYAERESFLYSYHTSIATQILPMMSVQGAWLQGLSAPCVFEDVNQLKVMAIFADDCGVGVANASRFDAFRAYLSRSGHYNLNVSYEDISEIELAIDSVYEFPSLLLAMSRRSDRYYDELLGVDWLFRKINFLPPLKCFCSDSNELDALILNRPLQLGSFQTTPFSLIQNIIDQFAMYQSERYERVLRGAYWAFENLQLWDQILRQEVSHHLNPKIAVGIVIRRLAKAGAAYHHNFKLKEKTLSEWLHESLNDPAPLVEALAESKLIVPGKPEKSPLVTSLISLKGKMFRIFSENDIFVLKRWISNLNLDDIEPPSISVVVRGTRRISLNKILIDEIIYPNSLRHAYFLLQGRALSENTKQFANDYIHYWLKKSLSSLKRSKKRLPTEWSAGILKDWLINQHENHSKLFIESDPFLLPSREEVIRSTLQLAPLTLIDGAWLQGFTDLRLASSAIGFSLFQTYWDELGNGIWEQNHPKIYRDVLLQMGIELPPTGSWEFAFDERFDDRSFELPVYWLAIGKFPQYYQAEILGMNLAMELSGVGGGYLSAKRFLKHHGFSTTFVDLHNTIDNVQTGHSAWAVDAIESMMRRVDITQRKEMWKRICIGYESLAPTFTKWQKLLKQNIFSFSHSTKVSKNSLHHPYISQNLAIADIAPIQ